MEHDDSCRCMACCAEKFKRIDPAAVGRMPATRPCNWTLYDVRCKPVRTKDPE